VGAGSVGVTVGSPVSSGVSTCLQLTINVTAIANIKESIMVRIFFIEKSPPFNQLSKKSLFYSFLFWVTLKKAELTKGSSFSNLAILR
jgi:hypothetical protein